MNYVTGSLEMFKTTVEELRKEDELCDIATELMGRIKEAVMNRETFIEVDGDWLSPLKEKLIEEGYTLESSYGDGKEFVVICGWS